VSDEAAKHFQAQDQPEALKSEGRSYTLSITLHPNGQLDVSGPLNNKVLSYGLLGAAASKLDELYTIQTLEANAAKAQAARGGIAGIMKRANGGV
jgi:hypothetical protein